MLNITITEQTTSNMLRAIRAACNELLGGTADFTGAGIPVPSEERASALLAEQSTLASAFDKAVETVGVPAVVQALTAEQPDLSDAVQAIPGVDIPGPSDMLAPADADPSVERDSTGAEWNPELHARTKTKNTDGTWKKRRGAGKAEDREEWPKDLENIRKEHEAAFDAHLKAGASTVPQPPPAPAATLVTMNDIYALISGGKAVLNDVIAAAQAMGFSDVGAFSRDATPEQRAQLLAQLTKEA